MKIDIVCSDGSPLGVTMKDVWGEGQRGIGIGGAELGLLTVCEAWANKGYEVCLYNDPLEKDASVFEQRPKDSFEHGAQRDVVITFRSPSVFLSGKEEAKPQGLHVWWSTDQTCGGGGFEEFAPKVDKIVTISEFHSLYFKKMYDIDNTIMIDLPVRVEDYAQEVEKVPGRCIFNSVPARGLNELNAAWPRIKALHPEASLVITSDYRLWGRKHASNDAFRITWLDQEDITFMGAIPRQELVVEEMKAQVLSYPCIYDELFCISVAEAQVAGVYPVTSEFGAVRSTNMGTVLPGNPGLNDWKNEFATIVADTLQDPDLAAKQDEVKRQALARFTPEIIVAQWDEKVFK